QVEPRAAERGANVPGRWRADRAGPARSSVGPSGEGYGERPRRSGDGAEVDPVAGSALLGVFTKPENDTQGAGPPVGEPQPEDERREIERGVVEASPGKSPAAPGEL